MTALVIENNYKKRVRIKVSVANYKINFMCFGLNECSLKNESA